MLDDLVEDGRVQLVPDTLSIALGQYEVGVAKDTEVTRDGSPGRRELVGDLAGCARACPKELEDLAASRVGEGAKGGVHDRVRESIR
jgi:hypothetical protein